jgi:photosystem II stability/assembly factor-like uncharacterized protein
VTVKGAASRIAAVIVSVTALFAFIAPSALATTPVTTPDGLWTWAQPLPHGYPAFGGIASPTPGTLFVASTTPYPLLTRDGGASWSWEQSITSVSGFANLGGLMFVSAQEGWAWGSDTKANTGMLLHTTDGGASWQLSLTVPTSFLSARFADPSTGWVEAQDGDFATLYTTTDGGQSWSSALSVPEEYSSGYTALVVPQGGSRALLFWTLLSAGDQGDLVGTRIWRTSDGGLTWSAPTLLKGAQIRNAAFASPEQGWAVEEGNRLWGTSDGGASWQVVQTAPAGWTLQDVASVGSDIWAVSSGGSLHSADGGKSWSKLPGLAGARVSFADPQDGWITVAGKYLHTTDGGRTWAVVCPGSPTAFDELTAVSGGTVWAVGGGYILKSRDVGRHWKRLTRPFGLVAVAALNAKQAWAVGKKGRILHTADGGTHWTRQTSGVKVNLGHVVFADARYGWAAGAKGTLLRTIDGGRHWLAKRIHAAGSATIGQLSFADDRHGLALASLLHARLLKTSNGGRTWSLSQLPIDSDRPTAAIMLDATHALLIAFNPTVADHAHFWTTSDGGATWQQGTDLPGADLYGAVARSGAQLCAVGSFGNVATSKDGGATWSSTMPAGSLSEMSSVQFVGPKTLMIACDFGLLTRDLNTAPLR